MTASSSPKAAAIAELLCTPDIASIDQGVELAAALGDSEIFNQLLNGIRVVQGDLYSLEYVQSPFWKTGPHESLTQYAILRLIAESDHSLRERIGHVGIGVRAGRPAPDQTSWDIRWIGKLPNLQRVTVSLARNLQIDLTALQELKQLRCLEIQETSRRRLLIPPLEHLETIDAGRNPISLGDGLFPELQELRGDLLDEQVARTNAPKLVDVWATGGCEFAGFSRLGRVTLMQGFSRGKRLKGNFQLLGCEQIDALDVDAQSLEAPDLRIVDELRGQVGLLDPQQFDEVRSVHPTGSGKATMSDYRFPAETHLHTQHARFVGRHNLTKLDHPNWIARLRRISIEGADASTSLAGLRAAPNLRTLEIRSENSSSIPDLSPLIGMPELRTISFYPDYLKPTIPPELWHLARFSGSADLDEIANGPLPTAGSVPCEPHIWHQLQTEIAEPSMHAGRYPKALDAVERAAEIGPHVIHALLTNISLYRGRPTYASGRHDPDGPVLGPVINQLLEHTVGGFERLRSTETLRFQGTKANRGYVPIDSLCEFVELRTLTVTKARSVRIGCLPPSLRNLAIETTEPCMIDDTTDASRLTTVALFGAATSLIPALADSDVESVQISGQEVLDFRSLARLPRLKKLILSRGLATSNEESISRLALDELSVGPSFDLNHLAGHPTLQRINLVGDWRGISIPADLPVEPQSVAPGALIDMG